MVAGGLCQMVADNVRNMKLPLLVSLLLYVAAAIALIAIGAQVDDRLNAYQYFFGTYYAPPAVILMVAGVLVLIFAAGACVGAVMGNRGVTLAFSLLLLLPCATCLAAALASKVLHSEMDVSGIMRDTAPSYATDERAQRGWDTVQRQFNCCGRMSRLDWLPLLNGSYPISCCKNEAVCSRMTPSDMKLPGCEQPFTRWLEQQLQTIMGSGFAVAVFLFLGAFVSCFLAWKIGRDDDVSTSQLPVYNVLQDTSTACYM